MITAERLREVLFYNRRTGEFRWKVALSNRSKVGAVAGYVSPKGYRTIRIDRQILRANRLAILYVTGHLPEGIVDHIDGDPMNDAFKNLRDTTRHVNAQNRRAPSRNNKLGVLGVVLCKTTGRYRARIRAGGSHTSLGRYDTPEEAHAAYVKAKRKLHEGNTL